MRKIIPLLLSGILTGSFAQTMYVSPNGFGDCTQNNPCSLGIALKNASTNQTDDVIYLTEGVYQIYDLVYAPNIDEGNLTIEGNGNVVLDGTQGGRILRIDTFLTNDDGKKITIKNITFKNGILNNNNEKGAALHIKTKYADVSIENCRFENNTAQSDADGGGVYIQTNTGDINVSKSYFINNSSDDYSGGFDISSAEGKINVEYCIIKGNSGGYGGGGTLETSIGKIYLVNNIIAKNRSTAQGNGRGGGILINLNSGEGYIINNTIVDNNSSAYGGGLHIKAFNDNGKINIYNNIVYYNNAEKNGEDLYIETEYGDSQYKPYIRIENNNIGFFHIENLPLIDNDGKFKESNTINNQDPMFKDRGNEDYHLSKDSPLIDKGDSSPIIPLPETDIDGEPRISGNSIDIGADEVKTVDGNTDQNKVVNSGGGGGGCSLATASSPINALLYLALPFALLVRRFLRG